MQIRKDISVSLLSSVIVVLYGFVTTFLLPHYLTVKDYGLYRLFTLYIGYVGFFHFGILDSVQLLFGGKSLREVNSHELNNVFYYFFAVEGLISMLLVGFGYFFNNLLAIYFGIALFGINGYNFFIYLYQSVGKIKEAALWNMSVYILLLLVNVACLFLFKITNYTIYVINQFSIFLLVLACLALRTQLKFRLFSFKLFTHKTGTFRKMIRSGFVLMLTNILYIGLLSFDKLFVRYLFSIETFSFYSFAFAILIIGNSVFMAVGNSIYFHFKKTIGGDEINKLIRVIVTFISFGSAVVFFAPDLIAYFLPKYFPSIPILKMLLPAILPMALVGLILLNVFKTELKLALLVKVLLAVNGLSLLLYALSAAYFKSELAIALVFVFSSYLYLLISFGVVNLKIDKQLFVSIVGYLLIYFSSDALENRIAGFLLYSALISVLNWRMWTGNTGASISEKSLQSNS